MNTVTPARLLRPVLLFGSTGQLGRELFPLLGSIGTVTVPPRSHADLAQPDTLRDTIRRVRPSVIVNAAAVTNVDRAEREPELAHRVNGIAPGVMAEVAADLGALVVHFSTDYVFDGASTTAYNEDARPNPINVYGATKLEGEHRVAAAGASHLIVRTSWVYSRTGAGFIPTVLRQLERPEIRVVADQTGSPTWSRALAAATTEIVRGLIVENEVHLSEERRGVYHLAGSGAASRVVIATELIHAVAESTLSAVGRAPVVVPISASEFGALAPRPCYSALANRRARDQFGVTLAPWRTDLRRMLSDTHEASGAVSSG